MIPIYSTTVLSTIVLYDYALSWILKKCLKLNGGFFSEIKSNQVITIHNKVVKNRHV